MKPLANTTFNVTDKVNNTDDVNMKLGVKLSETDVAKAFRRYKKERCVDNWVLFNSVRNRCNQMICNAKRRNILNNVTSSSPAGIWKFLSIVISALQSHWIIGPSVLLWIT